MTHLIDILCESNIVINKENTELYFVHYPTTSIRLFEIRNNFVFFITNSNIENTEIDNILFTLRILSIMRFIHKDPLQLIPQFLNSIPQHLLIGSE